MFYNAIKAYGWDNFDHIILLTNCTLKFVDIMEQVLIKYFNSHVSTDQGYNSNWGGFHGPYGLRGSDSFNAKKIICLTTGIIYGSAVEAEEKTGIARGSIGQVCRGDQQYTYDQNRRPLVFVWYKDYQNMSEEDIKNRLKDVRSVAEEVICLNNLQIFDTPFEAADFAGTTFTQISRCCKYKVKKYNDSQRLYCGKHPETGEWLSWMFLYDYNQLSEDDKNELLNKIERSNRDDIRSREIYCLNTMELFSSVKEAAEFANLKIPSNISISCTGNLFGQCGFHPTTYDRLYWIYRDKYDKLSDDDKKELFDSIRKDAKSRKGNKPIYCINSMKLFPSTKQAS